MKGPVVCRRRGPLRGAFEVPGDKSISHRALLFAALASGPSQVRGLLEAEDVRSTARAVEALGAAVRRGAGEVTVEPPLRLTEPSDVIDCGNSGTSLRLLCGVLSAVPGLSVLTGDASLRRRPVQRVLEPLRRMGAEVLARGGDRVPPVVVRGGPLRGARHLLPVASAQVKSALLLAGLFAEGETTVEEPHRSRDHTERMLRAMGVDLRVDGLAVTVAPGRPRGGLVEVPGDLSSAAFFLCAAAALPGSCVTALNVGLNPTRTGLLDALRAMGARVEVTRRTPEDLRASSARPTPHPGPLPARFASRGEGDADAGAGLPSMDGRVPGAGLPPISGSEPGADGEGEPRGDVTVTGGRLVGIEIAGALVPRLIDELPALMVLATQAEGRTVLRDARELRVKESDRLASMGEALAAAGARIEPRDDGCVIEGPTPLRTAAVRTRLDHRIAMSMAVAQLFMPGGEVQLDDVACVATSFPGFFAVLDRLAGGAMPAAGGGAGGLPPGQP